MAESMPFSNDSNQLNYLKFVISRLHGVSRKKIYKMRNFAYFRILEVCEMARKSDYRFTYRDYKFLEQYGVSNTFICKTYRISVEDSEPFEVMNR